jgi:glycosyltransferase involved in cell wall biosynthesis
MNTGKQPLVTIGITCFNACKTISRAIKSAQRQTWTNLEILVVDDGSSDNSADTVANLAKDDSRIRLVQLMKNFGTGVARTTIVNEARGEYLAFLDDDDEAMPERIAAQIKAIEDYEYRFNTQLVACYVSRLMVKQDGTEKYVKAIGTQELCPYGDIVVMHLLCGESTPGYSFGMAGSGTLLARISVFHAVGDFDSRFRRLQDQDWAVRFGLLGGHCIGCREPLIYQHITVSEDKADFTPLKYALLLRYKHKTYLKEHGSYIYSLLHAHAKFYYIRRYLYRFRLAIILSFLLRPDTVWRQWTAKRRKQGVVS